MNIQLSELKNNKSNPRTIRDEQFISLKRSIAQFPEMLEKRGIAVIREGSKYVAIGGNQRYKALCDLKTEIGNEADFIRQYGCTEKAVALLNKYFDNGVPCVDCTDLSEEQQRRFIIADNLPFGEWDTDALANEWDTQELAEWGLPLVDFGLDSNDYSGSGAADEYEMPDNVDEIETDIVLGDLFEIGKHRLLCGDSTDEKQVEILMNGMLADMVFTDPPFEIDFNYKIIEPFCKDGHVFIMNNDRAIVRQLSESPLTFKGFFVFNHSGTAIPQEGGNEVFLDHVLCSHEIVGSPKVRYNKGEGTRTVIKGEYRRSELHKHEKPYSFISPIIKGYTMENFLVLDFFGGSGSTMSASEELQRTCYTMELSPKYCQIIVNRMQQKYPSLEIKKNGEKYM